MIEQKGASADDTAVAIVARTRWRSEGALKRGVFAGFGVSQTFLLVVVRFLIDDNHEVNPEYSEKAIYSDNKYPDMKISFNGKCENS